MRDTSSVARLHMRPLPATLFGVWAAVAMSFVVIGITTTDPRVDGFDHPLTLVVVITVVIAWSLAGALIASRHPNNATGWLLLVFAGVFAVGLLGDSLGSARTDADAMLPGHAYAAWVGHLLGQNPAMFGLVAIILLLFPTGRPPSPRWRWVVGWLVVTSALYTVLVGVRPGELAEVSPPTPNPFAIEALGGLWPWADALAVGFLLGGPVAIVGVVLRLRRSRSIERQQLKWLLTGAVCMVALLATGPLLFWRIELLQAAWTVAFLAALVVLPVTVGIAMLRHGLYEIDRIISRTATYAIVAALLGTAYAGTALLATSLLRPVTGSSDMPIALSTLLVAAAIRPLHRRVRTVVERRFHRRRYDAQLAIERFGQRLRDQLDVTDIEQSITELVTATFEPEHVKVWVSDSHLRTTGSL